MSRIPRLSKRQRRYIAAVIATTVTTLLAMSSLSKANADSCSLRQVTEWQLALHDSEIEQTPEYVRGITEAFLSNCPSRPEFYEASRIAGIAASDMDDPDAAVRHFANAGYMADLISNFYAISAFGAVGDSETAWSVRDRMVNRWRQRMEAHPNVTISSETTRRGVIYQVDFAKVAAEGRIRAAWVAVPHGAGWPATLTFSNDRFRHSLRQLKEDDLLETERFVDLNRCTGRRSLGQIPSHVSTVEFDQTARASLIAYLADPDQPMTGMDGRIDLCIMPARLLPNAPKG